MNYLDAAIGFAVVMAVFAGAATAVNEAIKQLLRSKARNAVSVINKIQAQLEDYNGVKLSAEQRFNLITSILDNPVLPGKGIGSNLAPGPKTPPSGDDRDAAFELSIKTLAAKKLPPLGTFPKISTEHVCRRTADALLAAGVEPTVLESVVSKISRDFDYYTSSISTRFQRNAKLVSLVIGVVIAFAFNINGYRILDTFIENPALSQTFASQLETLEQDLSGEDRVTDPVLAEELEKLKESVDGAAKQGLPVGLGYRPHCLASTSTCARSVERYEWPQKWRDFLMLLLTGLLIGLGAPFWFDVAKRLATVRSWFGGKSTAAEAKSGRDSLKSTDDRRSMIDEVIEDAKNERSIRPMYKTFRGIEHGAVLKVTVSDTGGKTRCSADLEDDTGDQIRWSNANLKFPAEASHVLTGADRYSLLIDFFFADADSAAARICIEKADGTKIAEHAFSVNGEDDKAYSAQVTIRMKRS